MLHRAWMEPTTTSERRRRRKATDGGWLSVDTHDDKDEMQRWTRCCRTMPRKKRRLGTMAKGILLALLVPSSNFHQVMIFVGWSVPWDLLVDVLQNAHEWPLIKKKKENWCILWDYLLCINELTVNRMVMRSWLTVSRGYSSVVPRCKKRSSLNGKRDMTNDNRSSSTVLGPSTLCRINSYQDTSSVDNHIPSISNKGESWRFSKYRCNRREKVARVPVIPIASTCGCS